jgi:hypothetical protein
MAGGMPSAGRGIRNLVARVGMVGGWVDVLRAGVGTTGPAAARPADATRDRVGRLAAARPAANAGDQVRDLRAARELYHNTRRAEELRDLAERLDAPLRIAVSGPPGCGVSTLVETLRVALEDQRVAAHAAQPAVHLIDLSGTRPTATAQKIVRHGPGPAGADASILLLIRHRGDTMPADRAERRSALTVGVLARVDELGAVEPGGEGMALAERAAAELAVRPEVRRRCPVVVPVAGLLAHAAATLTDAEFATLRGLGVPSALPGRAPGREARPRRSGRRTGPGRRRSPSTPQPTS